VRGSKPRKSQGCRCDTGIAAGFGPRIAKLAVVMKPIKSFFVLAILLAPAVAAAQPAYYGRGPGAVAPGGFHNRTGRLMFGIGGGFGGMHDDTGSITCVNCDFNTLAFEGDFHIGGMISPRLGLMFEAQINSQQVEADSFDGDRFLTQGAGMFAGQFWLIPQLWIKGGIGFANLQVDNELFTEDVGTGGALMGAIGVELFSARNFALELQGRIIEGLYRDNYHVTSGTIGLGLAWY
jgi:hypothetical protein